MLVFKTGEQDFLLRIEGDLDLVLANPGEVRVGDPIGVEFDEEERRFLTFISSRKFGINLFQFWF